MHGRVNGKLTRACSTAVHPGLNVVTEFPVARQAQLEAMDVILGNHLLYCAVCDNNNENCTVHKGVKLPLVRAGQFDLRFVDHFVGLGVLFCILARFVPHFLAAFELSLCFAGIDLFRFNRVLRQDRYSVG